jgi:hypothetical protein
MGRDFDNHEARARPILLDDGFQLLWGRDIDVLVSCAGILRKGIAEETTLDLWNEFCRST